MKATIERFRDLLESTPDAVVMVGPSGCIEHANTQAEKLFGYGAGELRGKPLEILLPDRSRGAHTGHRSNYMALSRKRSMGAGLELSGLRKDGSEFPVDISLSPLETTSGTLVISAIRDMTESKRIEQELRENNIALANANAELEAFSYSISHDLRAPLRHIVGYVDLLRISLGVELAEKPRHYLGEIDGSARRMNDLVDNLLEFSRVGRAEMRRETVDLNQLAQSALEQLRDETANRKIRWNIGPLPAVLADAAMLKQVFINLFSNALKYTRKREITEVSFGCLEAPAKEIVIFVRDNGVGFEMEFADRLFGVFQRLHLAEDFEGIGIGLANVRRIVMRHGGRTWAEGKSGEGATFYFSLPEQTAPSSGRPAP